MPELRSTNTGMRGRHSIFQFSILPQIMSRPWKLRGENTPPAQQRFLSGLTTCWKHSKRCTIYKAWDCLFTRNHVTTADYIKRFVYLFLRNSCSKVYILIKRSQLSVPVEAKNSIEELHKFNGQRNSVANTYLNLNFLW